MRVDVNALTINEKKSVLDAMKQLTELGAVRRENALVVVNDEGRLVGTLTDGDIRRGFLRGMTPTSMVTEFCRHNPIVVPEGLSHAEITRLMQINQLTCVPVLDKERRVLFVEYMAGPDDWVRDELVAVIMAGGEGIRLRPLTANKPKPMLEVGGRPILQIIVETLRRGGFRHIILNVRYLASIIQDYFGDGSKFDVKIDYIMEPKPMGTAGSLGLLPDHLKPKQSFLVINGDLLCTVDFRAVYDFHVSANYDFTLCGRPYEVKIPFGYPVIDGDLVTEFREKPVFTHLVNSGIYCMSPELLAEVPPGESSDMPDVIRRAIRRECRVGVFPLREAFHEIGRPESYAAAEEFYKKYLAKEMHMRTSI